MSFDARAAWRGRIAISALFLTNGFIMGSWAPQIPLLLPRHGISPSILGLLILGMGIGAIGAMCLTGPLINRFGSRAVLRMATLGAALALPLVVLTPSPRLLAVAMAVMGAAVSMMDVAMNANAVAVERRLEHAVMSATHGFWSLGGFAGGLVGGVAIVAAGPAGHSLIVSAVSLGVIALVWVSLLADEPSAVAAATLQRPRGIEWRQRIMVYALGAMALMAFVPESAILDWSALYLSVDHKASVATSGLAFAIFSAAMAAMRFAGDGLRTRIGAVATLRVSGIAGAAGLVFAAVAPGAAPALIGFAIAGVGLANIVPILFSAAGNQPFGHAGAGIATVSLIGYSGMLIAPSAVGVAAETTGLRVCFLALAGLLLAVAAMASRGRAADGSFRA